MIFYAKTPKRELFISELYLMLLDFFISYTVTKIVKQIIQRQTLKTEHDKRNIKILNPRGGDFISKLSKLKIQFTDD